MGVPVHPEKSGVFVERDEVAVEEDLRMVSRLVGVWRKQRDRRLRGSQGEAIPGGPRRHLHHDSIQTGLDLAQVAARLDEVEIVGV